MPDIFQTLRKLALALAFGAVGLTAFGPGAQAANIFEKVFWMSGPRYDGVMSQCEEVLGTISSEFADKESTFWNSNLAITGFADVREVAFRPWAQNTIPRRFCTASAMLSDGHKHQVHYSVIEDGGFTGLGSGVEWCVVGVDRNWAYNPRCRAARP